MTVPPAAGNWLYCNSYNEKGNMAAQRTKEKSGIGLNCTGARKNGQKKVLIPPHLLVDFSDPS